MLLGCAFNSRHKTVMKVCRLSACNEGPEVLGRSEYNAENAAVNHNNADGRSVGMGGGRGGRS